MIDLICGNCKIFNQAACSSPRCRSVQNPYAQFDSPACQQFERIPESLGVALVNQFQSLGYGDATA